MVRPNERALRGRNDVVANPGTIDASSGGQALAESLRPLGRLAAFATEKAGDELTRQVIQVEKQRGREAALEGETTTLATGQVIPTPALRDDNTFGSEAFNEGVLETLANRLQSSLIESMAEIQDEQRGNPEAFERQSRAFFEAFSQNIPPELRDDFELQFTRLVTRGIQQQGAIFARRETRRARAENADAIEGFFVQGENAGFGLVTPNPQERAINGAIVTDSRERLERLLDQVDPMGDPIYTGDQKAALLRRFDEAVLTASAIGGFERAPNKERYVERWIDTQRRDGEIGFDLVDKVGAQLMGELRRHNALTRANQAEFTREVNAAVNVMQAGRRVPGVVDLRQRAEARGDTASVQKLDTALDHMDVAAAFSQQPLQAQAEMIQELRDKPTADALEAEENLRLETTLSKIHATAIQALDPNRKSYAPYAYAESVNIVRQVMPIAEYTPLEFEERKTQRDQIQEMLKADLPLLRPREQENLERTLDNLTPDEVVATFETIRRNVDVDDFEEIVEGLSVDRPELAVTGILGKDDPEVARMIISGRRILAELPSLRGTKQQLVDATDDVVPDDLFTAETITALSGYQVAAEGLAAQLRANAGETTFDDDVYGQALEAVMGGVLEFNGRSIISPVPGMTQAQFRRTISRLTPQALIDHGNGAPIMGDGSPFELGMFTAGIFTENAELITSGPGRYLINVPGLGIVATVPREGARPQPYEIDLRSFIDLGN